ncbi:MAG: hypothetical protein C4547_05870 [Phycisphaerales bacterium]|nr:MAG: hypothetical protein C4547_05870 [Phycisphaerales bacterium]
MSHVTLPLIDHVWGCTKCARITRTCCQRCEVLVSAGDRERIAEYTGRTDFWSDRVPEDPAYADPGGDPNWRAWGFHADGSRPTLNRRQDGDCTFLTATGCSLPMHVRPLVCRLYPYTYTEHGVNGVSDECPREVVPPGDNILNVLDVRRADADRWHQMLYAELRTGKRSDEHRPYLRSA